MADWKQQSLSVPNEEVDVKPCKERMQATDTEKAEMEQTGGLDTAGADNDWINDGGKI